MRKTFLLYGKHTVMSKIRAVTRIACRKNTVKHINTGSNSLKNILRRANSHNVFYFFFRQELVCIIHKMNELISRFTNAKSADCNSGRIKACNKFSALAAQIFKKVSLHNREQIPFVAGFALLLPFFHCALCPVRRNFKRRNCFFPVYAEPGADVKLHLYVRIEFYLRLNNIFRRKKMIASVYMALKTRTFRRYFTQF